MRKCMHKRHPYYNSWVFQPKTCFCFTSWLLDSLILILIPTDFQGVAKRNECPVLTGRLNLLILQSPIEMFEGGVTQSPSKIDANFKTWLLGQSRWVEMKWVYWHADKSRNKLHFDLSTCFRFMWRDSTLCMSKCVRERERTIWEISGLVRSYQEEWVLETTLKF